VPIRRIARVLNVPRFHVQEVADAIAAAQEGVTMLCQICGVPDSFAHLNTVRHQRASILVERIRGRLASGAPPLRLSAPPAALTPEDVRRLGFRVSDDARLRAEILRRLRQDDDILAGMLSDLHQLFVG
jgi:hypothetical protein